jgi:hypothetical protein
MIVLRSVYLMIVYIFELLMNSEDSLDVARGDSRESREDSQSSSSKDGVVGELENGVGE